MIISKSTEWHEQAAEIPNRARENPIGKRQHLQSQFGYSRTFSGRPEKLTRFGFGVANEMAYHLARNMARYRLYFTLEAQDQEGEPLGVKVEYGIEFHFEVENLNDFAKEQQDGTFQLDAAMGATLLGIAFSTARGIIFERTRGTFSTGSSCPWSTHSKYLRKSISAQHSAK
jgi:hypothetical protein